MIVGQDPQRILHAVDDVFRTGGQAGRVPEDWDGRAAERIVALLGATYRGSTPVRPEPHPPFVLSPTPRSS